jgi:nitronate monooxygenase
MERAAAAQVRKPFPHALSLPLIAAPMFLISGPALVLAACREGLVGAFPTPNCRTAEALEDWFRRISSGHEALRREANGKPVGPWAATIVTHRTHDRCEADLALAAKYKSPIVITALGSPRRAVDVVHGYGGLVFADVNSLALARKAADCGVDGLILVSSGAGGHTGSMAGFSFVPQVRQWWDGFIVYAGGVCDGAGIRAAEVLGADLCYMGTMFIATAESQAQPEYKRMLTQYGPDDLVVTKAFTGANASMLRPTIVAAGLDPDNLQPRKQMEFRGQNSNSQPWKGIWSAGQGIAFVDRVKPVAELVSELSAQYAQVRKRHG